LEWAKRGITRKGHIHKLQRHCDSLKNLYINYFLKVKFIFKVARVRMSLCIY
jgi:hypothetical protein